RPASRRKFPRSSAVLRPSHSRVLSANRIESRTEETHMSKGTGTIVQCIGAVVDIEFPRDQMPEIYDALVLEADASNKLVEQGLTFEVQQQLGDGIVRTIALGSTDRGKRGMAGKNTGANILW